MVPDVWEGLCEPDMGIRQVRRALVLYRLSASIDFNKCITNILKGTVPRDDNDTVRYGIFVVYNFKKIACK